MSYGEFVQEQKHYARIFTEARGPGPFACHFCHEVVHDTGRLERDGLVIHHIDHDRTNSSLDNLRPCHLSCHTSHHRRLEHAASRGPDGKSTVAVAGGLAGGRAGGLASTAELLADGRSKNAVNAALAANAKRTSEEASEIGKNANAAVPHLSCVECGREMSKANIGRHLEKHNASPSPPPLARCPICRKEMNKRNIKRHILKHNRLMAVAA